MVSKPGYKRDKTIPFSKGLKQRRFVNSGSRLLKDKTETLGFLVDETEGAGGGWKEESKRKEEGKERKKGRKIEEIMCKEDRVIAAP